MSTSKKKRKRRKRSYSNRQNNNSSNNSNNTQTESETCEIEEPASKKIKYTDYRRRSDRIKTKVPNYNDDKYYDEYNYNQFDQYDDQSHIIEEQQEIEPQNDQEAEDDDDDDEDIQDDMEEQNIVDIDNNQLLFTSHSIPYHRTYRTILNHTQLNKTEIIFKNKAYQYVNNYFQTSFKNSNQIWTQQKNKYETQKEEIIKQKQNLNVLPFAKSEIISHDTFLQNVAQNVGNTSKYLHITGNSNNENGSDNRIDFMVSPIEIELNDETCPIPHSTPYVTVNRNHYVKDDKNLRYIAQIGMIDNNNNDYNSFDSDTEFEEQEDILLDYIYENLELDDDETILNLEKIFYLSFERIQHRIMSLSHHKEKLLKQQKKKLIINGYDTKNKDIPIDSFSLLFCPRCCTYDCSLHGLDNPRRKNRELPSDTLLTQNCNYFNNINGNSSEITSPNALAVINGNYSLSNHIIKHLLPTNYKTAVTYPNDLSQCEPCSNNCYVTYINNNKNKNNQQINDPIEWNYMDLANLRRLLNICKKNFCQIACILGHISCENVYLKAMQLIPDLIPYINEKNNNNNKNNMIIKKNKPQMQEHMLDDTSRKAKELNSENIPHQFFGCKHIGKCSIENNCSCIMNVTYCEKYCACNIECEQRFPGCSCTYGQCRTELCQCYKSHRECDPDKCQTCQSYLPPHVFDKAIQWLQQNALQYYQKHYEKKSLQSNKSGSNSSLLSINEMNNNNNNNNNDDDEQKVNDKIENKEEQRSDVRIEIDGIANINPYNLCGNLCCTHGRKKKLWIGKSDVHGFGCFAGETIHGDEYITEYLGEMITQHEADRRGRVYDEQNISYLFNLNEEYCIDATRKGSKMKFANHSIQPNCRAKIITVNGDHRICIYAKKDLQIGHELLFDYRHDNVDSAQQPQWFHHHN